MTTVPTVPVQRTDVDGVPVVWVDTPGRLHAQLVFGVGITDETFLTTGVTHLVEHLVMRGLDEFVHEANAGVGLSVTTFEVTSSPPVVVEHLRRLCAAIADPDVAHIALERGVISAEEDRYGPSPLDGWSVGLRYGNRGPGLLGNAQLAAHLLDGDAVAAWSRSRLHRGNAVLVLDGPPPEGLALPLPDGTPVPRVLPPVIELSTPAYAATPMPGLMVVMHCPWSAELATGLHVLDSRLTRRLRREAGLIYEIDVELSHVLDGTACIGMRIDAPDAQVPAVWAHVHEALDELCTDGPSEADLQRDRDELRESRDDVAQDARDRAFDVACELLTGIVPSVVEQDRVLAGLDPHRVALALRAARDSMVVSVPFDVEPPALPRMPDCPVPPVTGRVFTRALFGSSVPRGGTVILGDDGATMTFGRGSDPVTVHYADLVAVGVETGPKGEVDELLVLYAGEGDRMLVRARDWRDGRAAVEAIRAKLPTELFFTTPERMRVFGPE